MDLSSSVDISKIAEEDDIERRAHFFVYATKLQSLASSSGGSMGLASGLFDLKTLMHWSVVVIFEKPQSVYTFDADTVDGSLTGGEFVVKVRREFPTQVQRKISVGSVIISPRELIRRAQQVRLNGGKYDFIFANCQSWAHQFCREISPDFANNLPVTIGDCTTFLAAVGTAVGVGVVTAGLAGWAIYKSIQHRRVPAQESSEEDEEVSA